MISSSLVLLLAVISCIDSYELTQPESLIVRPGATLTINCKVSYSVTSEETAWIRQPAGKALEWIGIIWSDGSTDYKDSLKSKFSISRDTSSNTITLQGKNMRAEDTAVYYCARYGGWGYFDYWGKGTKVTVSSAQSSAPKSIFAMSQCTPDSSGYVTVGCMARGFAPEDSLTFKWTDKTQKELSDFVQYPAFGSGGQYTKISHIRVKKSDLDPKKPYKCEASNSNGKLVSDITAPSPPPDQRATVYLTVPTKTELENETATFMCLARRFSPNIYTFEWSLNGQKVTHVIDKYEKSEKNGSVTEYSATSILQIKAEEWKKSESKVKCKFEHKAGNEEIEAEYAAPIQDCSDIDVQIVPPSLEAMLKNRTGVLKCKALAENTGFAKITITADKNNIAETEVKGTYKYVELDAPIGYEEWSNGTEFTCTVEHNELAAPKSTKFVRENALIVWIEHLQYEAIDTDDSGIANTAVTFVFLFLITLFYSIGATFVKVK